MRVGRTSEELNFGIGFSDEDIKDEIKFRLMGLFNALVCDIVEQGLQFPIKITLEYERENMNQRFKATAESLQDSNDKATPN